MLVDEDTLVLTGGFHATAPLAPRLELVRDVGGGGGAQYDRCGARWCAGSPTMAVMLSKQAKEMEMRRRRSPITAGKPSTKSKAQEARLQHKKRKQLQQ